MKLDLNNDVEYMHLKIDINGTPCSDICLRKIQWPGQLPPSPHICMGKGRGGDTIGLAILLSTLEMTFNHKSKRYFNHYSKTPYKENMGKLILFFFYMSFTGWEEIGDQVPSQSAFYVNLYRAVIGPSG